MTNVKMCGFREMENQEMLYVNAGAADPGSGGTAWNLYNGSLYTPGGDERPTAPVCSNCWQQAGTGAVVGAVTDGPVGAVKGAAVPILNCLIFGH